MSADRTAYWAAYHERLLKEIKDATANGLRLVFSLQTSNDGGCQVAERAAADGAQFGYDTLLPLPLPGCSKAPNCTCVYCPRLPDKEAKPKRPSGEVEREYRETLARLPKAQANAVKRMINAALRGFEIEPEDDLEH